MGGAGSISTRCAARTPSSRTSCATFTSSGCSSRGRRCGPSASARERFGPAGAAEPASGSAGALIERLAGRARDLARYQAEGEIARGGMGAVLRVWDGDLRRHPAMKVALEPPALARFLEEAQVTVQIDHPGIVRKG